VKVEVTWTEERWRTAVLDVDAEDVVGRTTEELARWLDETAIQDTTASWLASLGNLVLADGVDFYGLDVQSAEVVSDDH